SLRKARTVSRAITLPPMAAWIGTWNMCGGISSLSFSTMARPRCSARVRCTSWTISAFRLVGTIHLLQQEFGSSLVNKIRADHRDNQRGTYKNDTDDDLGGGLLHV